MPLACVPPEVTYRPASDTWILMDPWECRVNGVGVSVPAGFRFDLASIPRILWPLVAPFELSIAAPLVHDYLYRTQTTTRRAADRFFRVIMEEERVGWLRRWAAWFGVRAFGWLAWANRK